MPHTPQPRRRKRHGTTLVEVMLAGAMISTAVLSMLEGFTVAARICHENAELLKADNIAFDLLWRKFHQSYDDQLRQTENRANPPLTGGGATEQRTSDASSPYRSAHTINTWPTYPDSGGPSAYKYREIVGGIENGRGGKWLSLRLQYGPSPNQIHQLYLFRCEIDRGIPPSSSN